MDKITASYANIEKIFDGLFIMLGNIALSLIKRLAPFSTPAAPAFFFGHAVYTAVYGMESSAGLRRSAH